MDANLVNAKPRQRRRGKIVSLGHTTIDPLEEVIAQCYQENIGGDLDSHKCEILACALEALKVYTDWLDDEKLLHERISYLFNPSMIKQTGIVAFLTHPLFLRDILENGEIHAAVHSPIAFVAPKLATFLFREYPVLLFLDLQNLRQLNQALNFIQVGGLVVVDSSKNVRINNDTLKNVVTQSGDKLRSIDCQSEVDRMIEQSDWQIQRVAAVRYDDDPDHWALDQHEKSIRPGQTVRSKEDGHSATVSVVEPGEVGQIIVDQDGGQDTVSKMEFDHKYVLASADLLGKPLVSDTVKVQVGDSEVPITRKYLANFIRDKLKASEAVKRLFVIFEVDPDRINEMHIHFKPLEKKYADTDENGIVFNERLLSRPDFIKEFFFVFVHEIVHWLTRLKEDEAYFNDPEEVFGFVASIAYELENGASEEELWQRIFPKVDWHFHDEKDAQQFFANAITKAKKLLL